MPEHRGHTGTEPIRVGIVGVGNCASSFVQGPHHYRDASGDEALPGLISPELGGYRIGDITVASAFDVSIDPGFMRRMAAQGVLDGLDAVAVHGFPLDWNLWQIHDRKCRSSDPG